MKNPAKYFRAIPVDLQSYYRPFLYGLVAVAKMIDKSVSLLVVISPTDETPIGIVTLHDIFRLQNQLAEAM
jgi:hypothetical protein